MIEEELTPKELANKILNDMNNCFMIKSKKAATKCALIYVDGMIEETRSKKWYDVKKELKGE